MKTESFHWASGDGDVSVDVTVSEATVLSGLRRQELMALGQRKLKEKSNRYFDWLNERAEQPEEDQTVDRVAEIEARNADTDFSMWLCLSIWYPNCVAGTKAIKNGPDASTKLSLDMGPEEFMNLPERFANDWLLAVQRLNPHWQLGGLQNEEDEEGEASAPATENGSTNES